MAVSASESALEPHVWALELAVPDPIAAAAGYADGLGFTVEREAPSGAWAPSATIARQSS